MNPKVLVLMLEKCTSKLITASAPNRYAAQTSIRFSMLWRFFGRSTQCRRIRLVDSLTGMRIADSSASKKKVDRAVQQGCADRRADVLHGTHLATSDSMYGRVTFGTRHISAAPQLAHVHAGAPEGRVGNRQNQHPAYAATRSNGQDSRSAHIGARSSRLVRPNYVAQRDITGVSARHTDAPRRQREFSGSKTLK